MQQHPVILFDGVCNFCSGIVKFISKQDKKRLFRFAPLQSDAGQQLLQKYNFPVAQIDSFILIDEDKLYQKSTAALKLYNKLPWYWKWTQVFWIIPKFFRDSVYNFIAKNRYKWFGKKDECMIPTDELKSRFL